LAALKDHHFLPVRFPGTHKSFMFMVDSGATMLTVNRRFLRDNDITDFQARGPVRVQLANGREVDALKVMFHDLRIGPFKLADVPTLICEDCALLAGKSVLKQFRTTSTTRDGVEYLELRR
jgi:predicted aspartyl protease